MSSRKNNKNRRTNNSTKRKSVISKKDRQRNRNITVGGPIRNPANEKKANKARRPRKPREKNNKSAKNVIMKIIITFVILFILAVLIGGGVFVGIFFSDKFAMTKEDLLIGYSNTVIYDADGNVISELSGKENRKIITLNEMSEYLPKAFVSIEDERFYKHNGIDIKRTTAATFKFVTHSGSSSFGGSTITQQLVKNITNEKESSGLDGMQRKIREMSRAYQIEKMISKDQILELYLNLIPLASSGGDICGVETAALYYFNKSANDLTIEECAFLAGVTHSPSQYNPYKENANFDRIKERTTTVLKKMKELHYINDEQYNDAIGKVNEGLKFEKGELSNSTIKSYYISAAVDEVINDLVEDKGMSLEYAKNRVYSGGLKIYTTQKADVQQKLETEYKDTKYVKASKEKEGQHTQSAMVIIDHKTGQVIACMGGLGTDVDAVGVNRINSARQPGSSIKPIAVYGPALEKGIINAATIYDNTYTEFSATYHPQNATTAKSGLCNIRDALEVSSNIVACKVMSELTPDASIDYLRDLGVTSLKKASEVEYGASNDSNLSTALGGVTTGISPLQMAAAYAAIANDGTYIEPTFYSKVEDSSGNVIVESVQQSRRVMSEGNAYIMKKLLQQPVEGAYGTAKICKMNNMDVSAKTGTTQAQNDVWLCGFTPYYTAATWFGYDYQEYVNTYGGSPATLIWNTVMRNIHEGLEGKRYEQPSNVVTASICRASGKCAGSNCTDVYTEYFVQGAVPGKCEGHNQFTVCSETKKLATEFCPKTETVWGLAKPEKEVNAKWKTKGEDKYTVITEKCDKHTESEKKETEVKVDTDIIIPNVVGKKEVEARKALGNIGITVEHKTDTSKADGVVISQSIKAGSIVSKNAKITLVINKLDKKPDDPKPTATSTPTPNITPNPSPTTDKKDDDKKGN